MRYLSFVLATALFACADVEAPAPPVAEAAMVRFLESPDPHFRLSAAERSRLVRSVDPDVLEELLAWTPVHQRRDLLAAFSTVPMNADLPLFPGAPQAQKIAVIGFHLTGAPPAVEEIVSRLNGDAQHNNP